MNRNSYKPTTKGPQTSNETPVKSPSRGTFNDSHVVKVDVPTEKPKEGVKPSQK